MMADPHIAIDDVADDKRGQEPGDGGQGVGEAKEGAGQVGGNVEVRAVVPGKGTGTWRTLL